jgi:hypothetical protein
VEGEQTKALHSSGRASGKESADTADTGEDDLNVLEYDEEEEDDEEEDYVDHHHQQPQQQQLQQQHPQLAASRPPHFGS